ncbi:NUDIX hydrolase [Candidatus Uhrbacteria bacterium]|nr:NUDIX hydrolase [Candidatus Uhrbacteria bacterium]
MPTKLSPSFATEQLRRPLVATDIVVFAIRDGALSVVLIRRAMPPFAGKWALPGGFVLPEETVDRAAQRELREETDVQIAEGYLEQLYTFGNVHRDPRGRVISVAYLALIPGEAAVPRGGSDAAEAQWWPMERLPPLAFDHAQIIAYAVTRLRYKLEYTNVLYAALPNRFSLTELQEAYEAVLGKSLDKRNFRKKIVALGFVQPTTQYRKPEQGRPAQLWRFTKRTPVSVKTFVTKAG